MCLGAAYRLFVLTTLCCCDSRRRVVGPLIVQHLAADKKQLDGGTDLTLVLSLEHPEAMSELRPLIEGAFLLADGCLISAVEHQVLAWTARRVCCWRISTCPLF